MHRSRTSIGSIRLRHRVATRLAQALALTSILLAMLSVGGGNAAAQGTIITRDSTFNALSSGILCTVGEDGTEICSDVNLYVGPGKFDESTIVCVEVVTHSGEEEVFEEGCADVAVTFAMDIDELSWATLAATPVDLYGAVCTGKVCEYVYTRTISLEATWTAAGDLVRVHEMLGNPHGPCTTTAKIGGYVRDAAASVNIDGASVTWKGSLQALDDKTKRRVNCDEE